MTDPEKTCLCYLSNLFHGSPMAPVSPAQEAEMAGQGDREGAEGWEVRERGSRRAPPTVNTQWPSTQPHASGSTAPHDAGKEERGRGRSGAAAAGADTSWQTGAVRSSAAAGRNPRGNKYEDVDDIPVSNSNSIGEIESWGPWESQAATKVISGAAQPHAAAQPHSGVRHVKRKGEAEATQRESQRDDKKPRGSPAGIKQADRAPNTHEVTNNAQDLPTLNVGGTKISAPKLSSSAQPMATETESDDSEWTLGPGFPGVAMTATQTASGALPSR